MEYQDNQEKTPEEQYDENFNRYNNENSNYDYDRGGRNPDGYSLACMITGICSIVTCCCYGVLGIILGIAAIVLFILVKKHSPNNVGGQAIAGMICGCIGLVLSIAFLIYTIWVLQNYTSIMAWLKTMEENGYGFSTQSTT